MAPDLAHAAHPQTIVVAVPPPPSQSAARDQRAPPTSQPSTGPDRARRATDGASHACALGRVPANCRRPPRPSSSAPPRRIVAAPPLATPQTTASPREETGPRGSPPLPPS